MTAGRVRPRPDWAPVQPSRIGWAASLARDQRIGPQALLVGTLLAIRASREKWPRVALASMQIAQRVQTDYQAVERAADALAALDYLQRTEEIDTGGRRLYVARSADGSKGAA